MFIVVSLSVVLPGGDHDKSDSSVASNRRANSNHSDPSEDGYSSHGSRHESKDFSFASDGENEGEGSGDVDGSGQKGLIAEVGLESSSSNGNDVWRDAPGTQLG